MNNQAWPDIRECSVGCVRLCWSSASFRLCLLHLLFFLPHSLSAISHSTNSTVDSSFSRVPLRANGLRGLFLPVLSDIGIQPLPIPPSSLPSYFNVLAMTHDCVHSFSQLSVCSTTHLCSPYRFFLFVPKSSRTTHDKQCVCPRHKGRLLDGTARHHCYDPIVRPSCLLNRTSLVVVVIYRDCRCR